MQTCTHTVVECKHERIVYVIYYLFQMVMILLAFRKKHAIYINFNIIVYVLKTFYSFCSVLPCAPSISPRSSPRRGKLCATPYVNHAKLSICKNKKVSWSQHLLISKKIAFLVSPGRQTPNLPDENHQFGRNSSSSAKQPWQLGLL